MSEAGIEALILRDMTGRTDVLLPVHCATESAAPVAGGTGWLLGDSSHYDREYASTSCSCAASSGPRRRTW
jgi:type I restriction enzyme, R subunit